jgi:hypothetical protein
MNEPRSGQRKVSSMMVLVDTNQLSEVAAAEVEAIAHMRLEEKKKKFRAIRDARKMSYPSSGSASDFRRSDNSQISDGKLNKGPLPGETPMVAGESTKAEDGQRDDAANTGETVPGREQPRRRR